MTCSPESSPEAGLAPRERVTLTLNGRRVHCSVDARQNIAGMVRDEFACFGTRVGCEQGVCGSCTVVVDGEAVRGCLMLAVQADGATVTTIEGCTGDPVVGALQDAFVARNAMQCGFCTAGMLLTTAELLRTHPTPTREEVREHISGNYCRCTGYQAIVDAVMSAAEVLSAEARS